MSSSPDPRSRSLDLEADLPTTAADVAALRRVRRAQVADLERLALPAWLVGDALRRRPTFAGCPPFELE